MVLTTKQTKANAPATPSRSSSSTAVTPKATRRASLNVKPATSIPTPALKETYVDGTGSSLPPEVRNPSAVLTTNPKHDHAGPFADNPKFLVSVPKQPPTPDPDLYVGITQEGLSCQESQGENSQTTLQSTQGICEALW